MTIHIKFIFCFRNENTCAKSIHTGAQKKYMYLIRNYFNVKDAALTLSELVPI